MYNVPVSVISNINPHGFHVQLSAMHRVASRLVLLPEKSADDIAYNAMFYRTQQSYLDSLRLSIAPYVNHVSKNPEKFIGWMASLAHIGPGQQHAVLERIAHEADSSHVLRIAADQARTALQFKNCRNDSKTKIKALISSEAADLFDMREEYCFNTTMIKFLSNAVVPESNVEFFPPADSALVWETLALENMELALMSSSRYVYQQVGSVIAERICAPRRFSKILAGLKRTHDLTVSTETILDGRRPDNFFILDWAKEFIVPIIRLNPAISLYLAEGAMMRLLCVERCMDRYDHDLDGAQDAMEIKPEAVVTG